METTYKPIGCALHDEYEIAIMQRQYLNIEWLTGEGSHRSAKVLPTDILIKNKEEFLVATDPHGVQLSIRLDKITIVS